MPVGRAVVRIHLRCVRLFSTSCRRLQDARPPTAPKQHPDIAHIRRNVDLYATNAVLRHYERHQNTPKRIAANAQRIAEADTSLRKPRVHIKALQAQLTLQTPNKPKVL